MKKLPVLFLTLFAFISFALVLPAHAQAQTTTTWTGVCVDKTNTDVATIQGAQCLIANVLSIAVSGIGLVGFVLMIVGAFKILLGGDSKAVGEGGKTILYAVLGLILALSAWIILGFIASFTGVNAIKSFRLPNSTTQF